MSKANKTKKLVDVTLVVCPFCHVEAGIPCIYEPANGSYHLSRMDAAHIQIALDKRDAKIYLERVA